MYYYTCNEGYKLLTKGWWSAAKCNDSVWSELLQCIVVTCEPPPKGLIVKGLPEDHGPILPERLIQISCPPEKTLNGNSGLSCGQDGQWNGPFPTCEDSDNMETSGPMVAKHCRAVPKEYVV
ncbi:hypothetical protein Q8A73_009274 [Channa argus]|nr:hypothetical protein Q8A73_009274 [Channa argus]